MKALHGGDLAAVAAAIGSAPSALIDFSANINPAGPPPRVRAVLRALADDLRLLAAYPDPRASMVRAAIALRHGIAADRIAIGNGSAALLDAIVRTVAPGRCVLPVPAFSEYTQILNAAAIETIEVPLPPPTFALHIDALARAVERSRAEIVLLANPNNPTGTSVTREQLLALRRRIVPSCTIVVDEAFIDYVPRESLLPDDAANFIIVRSLTKFYGLAGMRVGYAVTTAQRAGHIEATLPSWPIGTVDLHLAAALLADPSADDEIRRQNLRAREDLLAALRERSFDVVDGVANFLLVNAAAHWQGGATRLRMHLAATQNIVVRACDDYRGLEHGAWIRIAVRDAAENARLLTALDAALRTDAFAAERVQPQHDNRA